NQRVLEEALNQNNPLLERLRFISIFSSNLDEFFMIRVAGLKDQVRANFNQKDNKSGLTPVEQLEAISKETHHLINIQQSYYNRLLKQLEQYQIKIKSIQQLSKDQRIWLNKYFDKFIFPILTPLTIDIYHPFPLLANNSLNIAVKLVAKQNNKTPKMAIVQVPELIDRLIQVEDSYQFVFIEELIIYFSEVLFPGYQRS